MSNSRYLRAWSDGTLRLHMEEVTSWEQFHMRQLKMVSKFMGANLGGWLITENWMSPTWLYEGVYKVRLGLGLGETGGWEGKEACKLQAASRKPQGGESEWTEG